MRVASFLLGVAATVLYLWVDPFAFLAAPVAAALSSVPVTLCFHGLTGRPWRASVLSGACVGVGLGAGTYFGGAPLAFV